MDPSPSTVRAPSDLPPSNLPPTDAPNRFDFEHEVQRRDSVEVAIRVLPRRANIGLTTFFSQSSGRMRLYQLIVALIRHHSVRTANAMAFDLFLALVPMLALAGWALTRLLVSSPEAFTKGSLLLDLTPSQLRGFITKNFHAFDAVEIAPIAVVIGWWLSSSAFYTMISVFEETFDCKPRSWLSGRLLSMGFALMGMVIFLLAGAIGVFITAENLSFLLPLLKNLSSLGLLQSIVFIASLLVISAFFALLYRYSIRRPGKVRRVWPGAITAATLGAIVSISFGFYVTNFARYALFYGGLAAIVVLMLWLWLWCGCILLGAELNIALEDMRALSTKADSRSGREIF